MHLPKEWKYCQWKLLLKLKLLFNKNISYKKIVKKLCQDYIKEKEKLH